MITMLQAALAPAITPAVLLGFMERIDDWTSSGPAVWSPEYAVRWRFVCVCVRECSSGSATVYVPPRPTPVREWHREELLVHFLCTACAVL